MSCYSRLGVSLLSTLFCVALVAQQAAEGEKPEDAAGKQSETKKRVELKLQSLGRVITVDVDGKVQQIDLGDAAALPENLKAKLPKDVLERVEKAMKEVREGSAKRALKIETKPGLSGSITIVDADGKTETRELKLDGSALKTFVLGEEIHKLLKDNANLPEVAQKALEDAMKATSVVVRSSSEGGDIHKKLDRILERLDAMEKQIQDLKGKNE